MDTVQLIGKVERLRAAVGAAEDRDLAKIKTTVTNTGQGVLVQHDFRGDLSQAQIENLVWTVIRSIADLQDHLRKWASANTQDKNAVDAAINSCLELAIIIDLANYDKHGGHDRNGGRSKTFPTLTNVRRGLRITTKAVPGAMAGMQIMPDGTIKTAGDAAVTVLGEAELRDGRRLEISFLQQRAI